MGVEVATGAGVFSAVMSGLSIVVGFIPVAGIILVLPAYLLAMISSEIQAAANRRAFTAGRFDETAGSSAQGAELSLNPMWVEHGGWGAQLSVTF